MAAEPAAPPTLRTMADLISAPEPKWLAEAMRILGRPVRFFDKSAWHWRLFHPDGGEERFAPNRLGGYPQRLVDAQPSEMTLIPVVPYPESAGLDHLQLMLSTEPDAAYSSDFPWRRRKLDPNDGLFNTFWCYCGLDARLDPAQVLVILEGHVVPLPNGQPARVWLGRCPRCGTIDWMS